MDGGCSVQSPEKGCHLPKFEFYFLFKVLRNQGNPIYFLFTVHISYFGNEHHP